MTGGGEQFAWFQFCKQSKASGGSRNPTLLRLELGMSRFTVPREPSPYPNPNPNAVPRTEARGPHRREGHFR
jgi:hypothetical protein